MNPTLFSIESFPPIVPGVCSGRRWNGWRVPLFPLASCEAIARACVREDGTPEFRFDPVTRCWMQAPPEGCEDEGEWATHPVMIDGVEHWEMGDGYCWDEVALPDALPSSLPSFRASGVAVPSLSAVADDGAAPDSPGRIYAGGRAWMEPHGELWLVTIANDSRILPLDEAEAFLWEWFSGEYLSHP